ncbi:unnamed protein product [Spirodela intermedia]|uniref:SURF1-like protein n=1 Tax=Spirodela intermedia TaxID=51605 RepID=A0A7I8ITU9_SPIIN|nr:unnamed protein product [Spirodela intermedia]CAA6661444.1 unnamed protein product [Spirodela intermedia]
MAASLFKALRLRRFLLSVPRNASTAQAVDTRASSFSGGPLSEPRRPRPHLLLWRRKEGGAWSKLLLLPPWGRNIRLGTWQIIRRKEKIEMIEHRRKRLAMEPIAWSNVTSIDEDLESLEFRKVECEGVFDGSKSIYIGPRSRSISGVTENGYYVITPLLPARRESNSVQLPILVNRGWVPREWRNKAPNDLQGSEKPSVPAAENSVKYEDRWWRFWASKQKLPRLSQYPEVSLVKVLGVVRGSERPSIFVPANNPESGQWFYVDVPMISRSSGLPDHTIYIEDIDENTGASNPYPVPKDASSLIRHSVMPQDHLNYTFTWYTLSAAVTFMAVKRIRLKGRRLQGTV